MKKKPPVESKKMAADEMKYLRKGGAPKKVMDHEKAEHKAMGYSKGGKVGSMSKKGC
jgi:hypothetical protein